MQTIRLFLLIALACLLTVPSVQAAPFVSPNGYSITPAAQWTVKHGDMTRTDVTILTHAANKLIPNLNVIVAPTHSGQTLEQLQQQITTIYPHVFKSL